MALLLREYLIQEAFGDAKLELWYSGENDFCGVLLVDCFDIPGNRFIHVTQVAETEFDIKWIGEPFDGKNMQSLIDDLYYSQGGDNTLESLAAIGLTVNHRHVSLKFDVTW